MDSVEQGLQITEHRAGAATYRGDVRPFEPRLKGPTTYGAWVWAASVDYDAASDTTRVEFVHTKPAAVSA